MQASIRRTLALEPDLDQLVVSVWHDGKRWLAEAFRLPEQPDQRAQPLPALVALIANALLGVRRDLV